MSKLTEAFEKFDRKMGKEQNLLLEKEMIEGTYKDNEILQRYIKVVKELEKIEKERKENKDNLYELNAQDEKPLDELTGKHCEVTFKKPSIRKYCNIGEFEKVKDNNKYYKQIWDKYIYYKDVKGSVTVKILKD